MHSVTRRLLQVLAALVVVTVAAALTPVAANIHITLSKDVRKDIDVGTFAFDKGGVVRFKIRDFAVAGLQADTAVPPKMGFAVDTVETDDTARGEIKYNRATGDSCFVDKDELDPTRQLPRFKGTRLLFWINGSKPSDFATSASVANGGVDKVDMEGVIPQRGMYAIFFFNCLLASDRGDVAWPANRSRAAPAVSMMLHIDTYNVDPVTGKRNYLPRGQEPGGLLHLLYCGVYVVLLVLWRRATAEHPQHVKRVHGIVQFLIAVKFVSLLCETFKFYHYAATGESSVWDFFYYLFLTLKGVTLFAVIVLLGSGWSSARAFLTENDKRLLLCLLPTQVVINVLIAVLEETSVGNWWWGRLLDLFRFLDIMCLFAVLLPLVWSMKTLREAAEHNEEKAVQNLQRMQAFRTFYLVVVGYVYATRVIVTFVGAAVPFTMLWTVFLLREACAAALYVYIYSAFRPGPQPTPYEMMDPEAARVEIVEMVGGDKADIQRRTELNTSALDEEQQQRDQQQRARSSVPQEVVSGTASPHGRGQ